MWNRESGFGEQPCPLCPGTKEPLGLSLPFFREALGWRLHSLPVSSPLPFSLFPSPLPALCSWLEPRAPEVAGPPDHSARYLGAQTAPPTSEPFRPPLGPEY